jgi:hypothetical protein
LALNCSVLAVRKPRQFYAAREPNEAGKLPEDLQHHFAQTGHAARDPNVRTTDPNVVRETVQLSTGQGVQRTDRSAQQPDQTDRIGFGIRKFENYRIRALLYAGRPNWRVLGSIVVDEGTGPRQNPKSPKSLVTTSRFYPSRRSEVPTLNA